MIPSTMIQIRSTRLDVSEYALHATRPRPARGDRPFASAFEVLKEILFDGVLNATFVADGRERRGVQGPYPAVCFTEQPPLSLGLSAKADPWRYSACAIAVRKDDLYQYGGRQVVYDSPSALEWLPDEEQYRWVCYDPTRPWQGLGPVDWTHEREWRVRPNPSVNSDLGFDTSVSAVPLRLPNDESRSSPGARFAVIVETEEQASELRDWIRAIGPLLQSRRDYWLWYEAGLAVTFVVSLEFLSGAADRCGMRYGRLEAYLPV